MTPDYVAVRPNWTVAQALEHVRRRGHDSETVDVSHVVDDSWKLFGIVSLRQLVLADPDDTIKDIMTTPAVFLSAFDDRGGSCTRYGQIRSLRITSSGF